jgi:hypothetical protein
MEKMSLQLQKARQLLVDDGWCQGQMLNNKGEHCLMDAILTIDSGISYPVYKVLDIDSLAAWNDHPCRTKEQVLELFDQAISLAMSEEAIGKDGDGL